MVAVLSSVLTLTVVTFADSAKLAVLKTVLTQCYIGEVDEDALEDAAADAMVEALGDRWSYYIPASEYQDHQNNKSNSYVGIGVTVQNRQQMDGLDILQVEAGGAAQKAGILPGDVLIAVDGKSLDGMDASEAKALIAGEEGTQVEITVLRDGEQLRYTLTRTRMQVAVAVGQMLDDQIGMITIRNFNSGCSEQTIAQVDALLEQGAQALIFDVRYNPGGYVSELVKLLDHLLPEGVLFRSQSYTGAESVDHSDADCVKVPMAVLINGNSYSAAEFFAAALKEYDWAVLAGEATTGKGYYQNTISLPDGSAVNLSVGKYFTPKGVCLADVGGLVPDLPVEVDAETAALIYARRLPPEEDPQVLAAVQALQKEGQIG